MSLYWRRILTVPGKAAMVLSLLCGCTLQPAGPQGAATAPARIGVADRQIILSGPQGYCIDKPAARDGAGGSFVLFGSCAAIAGAADGAAPVAPAVLTASVSGAGMQPVGPQMAALNAFLMSSAGRAALSRSGRATDVAVARAWGVEGVFFLAAQDRGAGRGQPVQAEFWRAVFDLRGRVVTLNVTGLQSRPLSAAAGRATLEAFVRQVRYENRGTARR